MFCIRRIYHHQQEFNLIIAQSLMTLVCICLIIPTVFNFAVKSGNSIIDRVISELIGLSLFSSK